MVSLSLQYSISYVNASATLYTLFGGIGHRISAPSLFQQCVEADGVHPQALFYDTGLVRCLTRWSSPEAAINGAMSGALLENYTVSLFFFR